jgi:hypothetical protein
MYRAAESPKPTATIAYHARRIRPGYLVVAFLFLLASIAVFCAFHATHFTCTRSSGTVATCHARRYALVHRLDETVIASQIGRFDVQVLTGSKGAKYAEVRLALLDGRVLELETGGWGHVAPDLAHDAESQFELFRAGSRRAVDAWLSLGVGSNVMIGVFGLVFGMVAFAIIREQTITLRPVRVTIDHARQVLVVRQQEIPFAELHDVRIEHGRALFWSSGKNEIVPGARLVFERKRGAPIPATKEFRAGDRAPHEMAQKRILQEIGRAPPD